MAPGAEARDVSEPPVTLPALLDDLAARFPAHAALISVRGRLDFATLRARADRVAAARAARGVGRGTRGGLLLPNWPEWLVVAFAVWRCGGVLVPLNTLYRARELGHALALAEVEVLVAVRRFLRNDFEASLATLPSPRAVVLLDPPADGAAVDITPLLADGSVPSAAQPDDPATIVFTSGSTADPKGVVHTHRSLCLAAAADAATLGIDADDRTWGYLPFFFAGGLVAVALSTLSRGAAVVLQDVFEPGETLRLLADERVTVFFAWPHQAEALLAHPRWGETRLHLRKGVGANTKWAARIYPPDHSAVGSYGMTETPPLCTAWPWNASRERRTTGHGPPVGRRELRIVDPSTGAVLPAGQDGEICVRGPELLAHYLGESPAACRDGDGFFHTGDLGHLDADGALHFVGRAKDVIKTAGANVAAAEVEAVLMEHPSVAAAHAVGVPDPLRGENVGAFVVAKETVDVETLLDHCRARLASYKVPRHVWLRREDALPQKGSGKVDKAALRLEAARLTAERDPP
jgi:fatty-acyl-CoA synthase